MKKLTVLALTFAMLLSVAACSGGTSEGNDSTAETAAADTTAAAEEETTAAEDSAAETDAETEAETEVETEDPNAAPEGYQLVEIENELFGVGVSFLMPEESRFERVDFVDQTTTPANVRYTYHCYLDSGSFMSITASVSVRQTNDLDWKLETNEAVPNTEYTGYITGHSRERDIPMNIYGDDYLDGKVYSYIVFDDSYESLDADEFNDALETLQKSIKFTVSDENKLYGDDGSLLNTRGLFSYPAELTIDDITVEPVFIANNDDATIYAEFTDSEGQEVNIREAGYGNDAIWEGFMESNASKNPYECEIGGYPAKGYIYQELSGLTGIYTLQIAEGQYYDVAVKFKTAFDANTLKAMMEGPEDRDELNQKMAAYADQFVGAATRLDSASADEAAADEEAETDAEATDAE